MQKRSLLIIFMVVFIDLLGFGIVIPILPYYAKEFGATALQLGWLMAVYSLMQFVVSPIWGRLSDRIGRRPVLLMTLLGNAAALLVLGYAKSLTWLFVGRIFAGICAANISVAYAYVADVTSEENRAKGMGLIGAGFGLGFIFGPAIGGLLSTHGYAAPMFAAAILTAFNWIFAALKLEDPKLPEESRAANRTERSWKAVVEAFADIRSAGGILLFLITGFAWAQMEVIFGIYLKARFGYEARTAGVLLAVMGIIMVIIQGGLIGRLSRKFGAARLIIGGTALCGLALLAFGSAPGVQMIFPAVVFMAFGYGLLQPSLSSITSLGAAANRRGATMGVFQSAGSLARVLGPPSAGWLYDHMGFNSPFFAGGAVFMIATAIALAWSRKLPESAMKAVAGH